MLRTKIDAYRARATEFDPDDLAEVLRDLRAKLATAEAKVVKAAGRPATHALVKTGDVAKAWKALDVPGKRVVIKENVEEVIVGRPAPDRRSQDQPMHGVDIIWRDPAP